VEDVVTQLPESQEIRELQHAFTHIGLSTGHRASKNLAQVVDRELWRKSKKKDGSDFESFPYWVVHPQPEGLGIDNQPSAEFLRTLFLAFGRVDIWAQVFEHIRVRQGRPKKIVPGDLFQPFYHPSRSSNAIDRRIRRLQIKAPENFELFLAGKLDFDEALNKAGISRKQSSVVHRLRSMLAEFKELSDDGQLQVLELLWSHTGSDARADFLIHASSRADAA
jgi:hypothetical protein